MPVINQVVAETRLTMAITSARVTRLTRGLGADRWPRYRPLARNSRASLVTCVCHRLLLGDPRAPRRRLAAPRPAPPRRPVTPRDSEERSRSSRSSLPRRTCARACSSPLQPLLTMIAIKFVFFFEDQRLSPLPIRLAHRRWRWARSFCRRWAEMICARVSAATLMRPSSVCLWEGGEGRAGGALGGAARGGTLGMEEKHVV